MIPLSAACPTLARTLTFDSFGAYRGGRALSDPLDLRLLPGTVLGVVGPNGVGKSSLLSALAHAGAHSYGRASYGDRDLSSMNARSRASIVSMLPQDLRAPDELRVRELVEVGAHASQRGDPAAAAARALDAAGIPSLAARRYGTLSGGQRQLVQLARVLAQDTPLVILDEPTSALDLFHQRAVEQTVRRLGNDGKIVVAALHDLTLALAGCAQGAPAPAEGLNTEQTGWPRTIEIPAGQGGAAGSLTIETEPQRIAALDYESAETLADIGLADRLVLVPEAVLNPVLGGHVEELGDVESTFPSPWRSMPRR